MKPFIIALALAVAGSACKKSKPSGPPPEVTGLAAVPASADVVIAIDVEALVGSPIVARAAEQLLTRDATLAQSWTQVRDNCKIDVAKQIRRVMIALGPQVPATPTGAAAKAGSASKQVAMKPGPVLLIATGAIAESDLAACVRTLVGKGGGSLTAKPFDGRTLYQVKDGQRTMFFAFGSADTIVLGTSDAYVIEALGKGKKALDHPELAAWINRADQKAPIWTAGRVPDRVKQGLVRVTQGKLTAGPSAFVASLDPTTGMKVALDVLMASADDAKQLESLVKAELVTLVMAAQIKAMGAIVQKLSITVDGSTLQLRIPLSMDDVNHLLSVLDGGEPPKQDSAPPTAPGSGSAGSAGSGATPTK